MFDLPLHPRLVHIPLGLLTVLPVVLAVIAYAIKKTWVSSRAWWLAAFLAAVVAGTAFAATRTGEVEGDRVESIVPEAALERHEEAGEQVLFASGALFVVTVVGLFNFKIRTAAQVTAVVASVIALGFALRAGHFGGELVYKYGAASTASQPATADADDD